MNNRLQQIIAYNCGGRQVRFAEMMGWSPAYLAKLLKGRNFGLSPVLSILNACPEVNARWFLLGQGEMLNNDKVASLQRNALSYAQEVLELEKYMVVMNPDELRQFEACITERKRPDFSSDTRSEWESRLNARNQELNARVRQAQAKSDPSCKHPTAKQ